MSTSTQGEHRGLDVIYSPSTTLCSNSPALLPGHGCLTSPLLQVEPLDTSPFSELFSDLIREEPTNCQPVLDSSEKSYAIESYTNLKELNSEWDDGDIDEILVMSPKLPLGRLPTIAEELCSEVERDTQGIALSDFELLEPTPHLCRKRDTGRIFVLKRFNAHELRESSEQTILGMLRALDAPFLPRVYWSFRDDDHYHMVMEYYPRHNLSNQLNRHGPLSPAHALFYACEIAEAVSALHAIGVVHRNINPENVLIDSEGHVILSGLEYAKAIEQSRKIQGEMQVSSDAKGYQAPEILLGWAHDFAVDCWGYGLLLHFMLSCLNPFQVGQEDRTSLYQKVIRDPIVLNASLETSARDLILKCLERNPAIRMKINAMGKHSYFANINWDSVAEKRIQGLLSLYPSSAHPAEGYLVPSFSELNLKKNSSTSMQDLRSSRQKDIMHSDPLSSNREPRKVLSTNDLPKTSLPREIQATTPDSEVSQALPPIFRMSSLFDDPPNPSNGLSCPKDIAEATIQSVLTLNDIPSNTQTVEVNTRDRMALFWESLDAERRSTSSGPSLDYIDLAAVRPRKLRKTRSSIYPEKRFSTLSTLSLQDRIRKKWKPSSGPPPQQTQKHPTVHFSQDIKQIGSGIGFTYDVPVATLSKASICSTTPRTCHGMFHGGIFNIGLGLRSGRSKPKQLKIGERRVAPSFVSSRYQDEDEGCPPFMQDFGGSSWSLVLPPMAPAGHDMESPNLTTASNSPTTDAGPLTPEGTDYALPVIDSGGFEDRVTHEAKAGDPGTTLRLVASLGTPPLRVQE